MGAVGRVFTGLAIAALCGVLVLAGLTLLYSYNKEPLPLADQCVAQVQDLAVPLDVEQTHNATVIVGVATQRGLAPRASDLLDAVGAVPDGPIVGEYLTTMVELVSGILALVTACGIAMIVAAAIGAWIDRWKRQ